MEPREIPPPYSDVPKSPGPPPQHFQGGGGYAYASGYAPPFSPTFEPPYMSAPVPASAPPPINVTSVTVTGAGRGVPGGCPVCSNTSWTGTYSCCAWLLCLFCFWNFGLCCCLCMRKKKCTKCGFTIN